MTEEQNECKCFCKSEGFRKFLVVAGGTFVGVYCALSLFFAIHKPPMPVPVPFPPQAHINGCPCAMMHHYKKFERPDRVNFDKQIPVKIERKAPFEAQR